MDRHLRIALLTAPLVAVLAVWAGVYLGAPLVLEGTVPDGEAARSLFFFTFLGAPVAYAITGLVGVPVARWLERTGRLRLLPLALIGAAVGAVGLNAAWDVFWGAPEIVVPVVAIGGSAGALAALVFWAIGAHPRRPRPAPRP